MSFEHLINMHTIKTLATWGEIEENPQLGCDNREIVFETLAN